MPRGRRSGYNDDQQLSFEALWAEPEPARDEQVRPHGDTALGEDRPGPLPADPGERPGDVLHRAGRAGGDGDPGNRFQMQENLDRAGLGALVPACWRNKPTGTTDVFGRLWWDRPAFTIRTEFYKPEKGRYLHPSEHRPITVREAARCMSMPDDFLLPGRASTSDANHRRMSEKGNSRTCEVVWRRPRSNGAVRLNTATRDSDSTRRGGARGWIGRPTGVRAPG